MNTPKPRSPEAYAILAAVKNYGPQAPEIVAQALRAILFLDCSQIPLYQDKLHQIAEELDP